MVSSVSGISMADYQAYLQQQGIRYGTNGTTSSITYANDSVNFSTSKERCTDGKDDGKIGIFSAVGNAIKGVGKTIVNGVKGMFTNSEGKFSLGKTLLSVGTAAVCIAFPAVGVAACAIGGAMGAVQVGKGIYNAATADTDAEAKEAWQNIGGGAFTVATSAVGAKAGINAVKSTSTATNGLASLDDTATLGQKLTALGKDMVSSSKNQYTKVSQSLSPYAKAVEYKYQQNVVKHTDTSNMSAKQAAKIDKYTTNMAEVNENQNIMDIVDSIDDITASVTKVAKHPIQSAKNVWQTAKGKVTKQNAETLWNGIKETYKTNVKGKSISELGNQLTGKAKAIWTELSTGKYSYPEVVNKYGFENVAEVIQYMSGVVYST